MSNFILSRNERVFLQTQTAFATINNTSGAATLAAANSVRHIESKLKALVGTLVRRDKTGSRTATVGSKGRQYGTWALEGSMVTNGAAGTAPDHDPLWQAAFGAAPTVSAGVSVTYNLSDVIKFFTLWSYRGDGTGTPDQRVGGGCVVQQVSWTLGQDVAEFKAEGECMWVQSSKNFGSATTLEKMGLTAFPAEPATHPTNGGLIAGFTGQATLGGAVIADIISANITYRPANEIVKNTFGSYLPTGAEGDERHVGVSFSVYDTDGADIEALKDASRSKTPIDMVLQIGAVAGSIVTLNIKQVQLQSPDFDDSQRRYVLNFPESRAYGSSTTAKDEIQMVLT